MSNLETRYEWIETHEDLRYGSCLLSHVRQVVAAWLRIPLGLLEYFWIGSLMALVEVYPITPLLNLHVNFSLFDQS